MRFSSVLLNIPLILFLTPGYGRECSDLFVLGRSTFVEMLNARRELEKMRTHRADLDLIEMLYELKHNYHLAASVNNNSRFVVEISATEEQVVLSIDQVIKTALGQEKSHVWDIGVRRYESDDNTYTSVIGFDRDGSIYSQQYDDGTVREIRIMTANKLSGVSVASYVREVNPPKLSLKTSYEFLFTRRDQKNPPAEN